MTLAASTRRLTSTPVVPTTTFDVPFPLFAKEDVAVTVDGVAVTTFTVLGSFDDGRITGGQVVLASAVSNVTVVITGKRSPRRTNNFGASSPGLAENLQNDMDAVTANVQEISRDVDDAVAVIDAAMPQIGAIAGQVVAAEQAADRAEAAEAAIEVSGIRGYEGAWATGFNYLRGSVVLHTTGALYFATVDHVSGASLTADLGLGKWSLFLPPGSTGAGSGDMLRANNLSDLTNFTTARSNLGLAQAATKDVANTFTQIQTFAAGLVRGDPPLATDLNNINLIDLVRYDSTTANRPSDFSGMVQTFKSSSTTGRQYAFRTGGDELWTRRFTSGVWQPWFVQQLSAAPATQETIAYAAVAGVSEVILNNWANDARYVGYQLIITEASVATDNTVIRMECSSDNGATWITAAGAYRFRAARLTATDVFGDANPLIRLCNTGIGSAAGEGFALNLNIHNADRASDRTFFEWSGVATDTSGASELERGSASRLGVGITNALRIYPSAGNFTGKFALIGLRGL